LNPQNSSLHKIHQIKRPQLLKTVKKKSQIKVVAFNPKTQTMVHVLSDLDSGSGNCRRITATVKNIP